MQKQNRNIGMIDTFHCSSSPILTREETIQEEKMGLQKGCAIRGRHLFCHIHGNLHNIIEAGDADSGHNIMIEGKTCRRCVSTPGVAHKDSLHTTECNAVIHISKGCIQILGGLGKPLGPAAFGAIIRSIGISENSIALIHQIANQHKVLFRTGPDSMGEDHKSLVTLAIDLSLQTISL